jgi:hypothetical protein
MGEFLSTGRGVALLQRLTAAETPRLAGSVFFGGPIDSYSIYDSAAVICIQNTAVLSKLLSGCIP